MVKNHADSIDIHGRGKGGVCLNDLRCAVIGDEIVGHRAVLELHSGDDSQVAQQETAIVVQENVLRTNILVDQVSASELLQGGAEINAQVHSL